MDKKNVAIMATLRVVSTIKNKPLTQAEQFQHSISIIAAIDYPADVVKALCDSETRFAFIEIFRERLRKDFALKREIGGTNWSVDVMDLNYEIQEAVNV